MEIPKETLLKLNRALFQIITRMKRCQTKDAAIITYNVLMSNAGSEILTYYTDSEESKNLLKLQNDLTDVMIDGVSKEKMVDNMSKPVIQFQKFFYNKYPDMRIPKGTFEVDEEALKPEDKANDIN